jgi:hypothetical protein
VRGVLHSMNKRRTVSKTNRRPGNDRTLVLPGRLRRQMSELISLREKVAQAELAASRRLPTGNDDSINPMSMHEDAAFRRDPPDRQLRHR